MATSVGPDGIDVTGLGWTNQSTLFQSNLSLESGGPASSTLINSALRQGYSAWTYDPAFSNSNALSIGTTTQAALVYVPETFSCTHFDFIFVATTGNVTAALWPATAPAGTATPLAFSAATTSGSTAGVVSLTFNGVSSPTAVTLTGGNYYFATMFSSAATTIANYLASPVTAANAAAGSTYSGTTVYRTGTVGTVTTVSTASVFGTSTITQGNIAWVGLR